MIFKLTVDLKTANRSGFSNNGEHMYIFCYSTKVQQCPQPPHLEQPCPQQSSGI